jgi:hypothetical protein
VEYLEEILPEKMPVFSPDAIKFESEPNRKKRGIVFINGFHNPDGTGVFRFKGIKRDQINLFKKNVQERIKL